MSISVLIADDHAVVRAGLVSLLKGSEVNIIGEAESGPEAVKKTVDLNPDAVLMDIRMVDGDGLTALEELQTKSPTTRIVMLSTYDNPTYIARSLALGASDYVLKGASREEIVNALQNAVKGEPPRNGSVARPVKEAMERREPPDDKSIPLTKREMQVLRHLALGLSNREIGQSMGISVETVKEHVQNVLRKLKVTDRTQAAVWAVKQSLV